MFINRHIGSNRTSQQAMLKHLGLKSIDELMTKVIPAKIGATFDHSWPACSEHEMLALMEEHAAQNQPYNSYIGLGYYGTITPSVILRNVIENPGWYTPYTSYQAEISQGRLEALFYFQSMVCDLTGLPLANASLLDEGTAAAEAMHMFYALKHKKEPKANTFLVSNNCFPQTIDVLKSRAKPLEIKLVIANEEDFVFSEDVFGILLQYPTEEGAVVDHSGLIAKAKVNNCYVAMACDLLALCLLKPPGELGADVALGNAQRFGVPLGYGGPHAAFFATTQAFQRLIPGRIVGLSHDSEGEPCYRLALQTREQHIRREKATSNICTAQALLACVSAFYTMYHGPAGLKAIAERVYSYAHALAHALKKNKFTLTHENFFDTLCIEVGDQQAQIKQRAEAEAINFRYKDGTILLSLDETLTVSDLNKIAAIFQCDTPNIERINNHQDLMPYARNSDYLQHPAFKKNHSETNMMRYLKRLENRDLSLVHSMIPLGSCTMKLNAATELMPFTWKAFSQVHPFVPKTQVKGYLVIINELEYYLNTLTGFSRTSFQPNAGAQGEFLGLSVIRAFQRDQGQEKRDVALIPASAHGTNPASAVMAGLKVVSIKCLKNGDIDLEDLQRQAKQHKDQLSCMMVTYPSTHGVFEEGIKEACAVIHEHGGQVYMDGANMNAMMGLVKPKDLGVDVCHLNLHKTFCIPHGGGGPGMGPICMAEHLAPYTPSHIFTHEPGSNQAISAIASSAYSSASILLISYAYITLCGLEGLRASAEAAILHANYIRKTLEDDYKVLFTGQHGFVAHELIIDCRDFGDIKVEDIAKRLMDYGFHPPTMSWPIPETLMIEPTESESKEELDRFCAAMLSILAEINASGSQKDNILKNAPHPLKRLVNDPWPYSYTKMQAVYPLTYLTEQKFWPVTSRIDNAFGDRHLVCSCKAEISNTKVNAY